MAHPLDNKYQRFQDKYATVFAGNDPFEIMKSANEWAAKDWTVVSMTPMPGGGSNGYFFLIKAAVVVETHPYDGPK